MKVNMRDEQRQLFRPRVSAEVAIILPWLRDWEGFVTVAGPS